MIFLYLFAAILGCLIVLRSGLLLVFAEIGRKQDLIKHIYKSGTDFQVAILIPFLDSRRIHALHELIQALVKQDYPATRIGIHVVATEEAVFALPSQSDLPANMKVWTYPARHANPGQCLSWLIERLLAAGGPSKLFVFLEASDIVRPDFLRNVTTRAFDCFAMQGYIALKRPPKGFVSHIASLSTRIINRVENAGRFHMGLSCKLLSSGWVVRQEILEMLPFRQGHDTECLEYATLLNLNGYRINWAPNVVVYKEEKVSYPSLLKEIAHSTVNRTRLALRYGLQLLVQGSAKFDLTLFEQAWCLVKPPNFVIGFLATMGAALLLYYPVSSSGFYYLSLFTLGFWSTQLVSLAVSRCNLKDIVSSVVVTPLIYLIGALLFPAFLVMALGEAFFQGNARPRKVRIGKRFDESQPAKSSRDIERLRGQNKAASQRILPALSPGDNEDLYEQWAPRTEENESAYVPLSRKPSLNREILEERQPKDFAALYEEKLAQLQPESFSFSEPRSIGLFDETKPGIQEKAITLPISNGKSTVECLLHVIKGPDSITFEEMYHLVFQYKSLSFTTQKYRTPDHAYYELLTKLKTKGFNILSCGSCVYFYRPAAEEAYDVAREHGFCLFGKRGKDIHPDTDAVTVINKSCRHYVEADLGNREAIVKQWQESLQQVLI